LCGYRATLAGALPLRRWGAKCGRNFHVTSELGYNFFLNYVRTELGQNFDIKLCFSELQHNFAADIRMSPRSRRFVNLSLVPSQAVPC